MQSQSAIEPQRSAKSAPRARRVSVSLPPELSRKVGRFAKSERRLFAPALVVLIEKGLQAMEPPAG